MGQFGIGQPVRRFEDKRLLCGNGRFQNDVTLPGQAYGYVLRSPRAHAALLAMDITPCPRTREGRHGGVLYWRSALPSLSQKAARRESCRWATIA